MARAAPPRPAATSSRRVDALAANGLASASSSSTVRRLSTPAPKSNCRMVSGSGGAAGSRGARRAAMAAADTRSASDGTRPRGGDVPAMEDARSAARLSAGSAILPLPRRHDATRRAPSLSRADRSSAICSANVAMSRCWWCRHHPLAQPAADRAPVEELLDVARRLPQPLAVLDQRNAHIALAVLAETHARRHRHIRLLEQELGESEAAHLLEARGQRRPGEHAGGRGPDLPAPLAQGPRPPNPPRPLCLSGNR